MTEFNKLGVIGLLHFHKEILQNHVAEIPFQKLQYVQQYMFFVYEKKTDILILKMMINNLCHWSNQKTQYSLIINYRGAGEEVWVERGEKGFSKWNQGKLMWVMLFWRLFLKTIKWDWREFLPKIGKWLTPYN